jgi:hypothetical protein
MLLLQRRWRCYIPIDDNICTEFQVKSKQNGKEQERHHKTKIPSREVGVHSLSHSARSSSLKIPSLGGVARSAGVGFRINNPHQVLGHGPKPP